MAAPYFTSQDFDEKVLKHDKPVLVDFYAEWCGPCQLAAPIIDKLSREMEGKILIGKVDVDANQDLSMRYGVMSIPTMILFKDGKVVEKKIGFPGESGIRKLLESVKE